MNAHKHSTRLGPIDWFFDGKPIYRCDLCREIFWAGDPPVWEPSIKAQVEALLKGRGNANQ